MAPSRRLVDGIAAGAVSVLVSDSIWAVGLPFQCLVPWRRLAITLSEAAFFTPHGAASTLQRLVKLSSSTVDEMQRTANTCAAVKLPSPAIDEIANTYVAVYQIYWPKHFG